MKTLEQPIGSEGTSTEQPMLFFVNGTYRIWFLISWAILTVDTLGARFLILYEVFRQFKQPDTLIIFFYNYL